MNFFVLPIVDLLVDPSLSGGRGEGGGGRGRGEGGASPRGPVDEARGEGSSEPRNSPP